MTDRARRTRPTKPDESLPLAHVVMPARGVAADHDRVLQLQCSAGNRAVSTLVAPVAHRRGRPYATTFAWPPGTDVARKAVTDFLGVVDEAVTQAWTIVTSRPLEAHEQLDGYTQRWADQWKVYDGNPGQRAKIAPLVPAMAGYAIESLATKLLLPKEWSGYRVVLQDPHGSTRPDVVLYEGDRDIAGYDITATRPPRKATSSPRSAPAGGPSRSSPRSSTTRSPRASSSRRWRHMCPPANRRWPPTARSTSSATGPNARGTRS